MDCRLNPNPTIEEGDEQCCSCAGADAADANTDTDGANNEINDNSRLNFGGLSLNRQIEVDRSRKPFLRITRSAVTLRNGFVFVFVVLTLLGAGDPSLAISRQTTANGIFIQLPYSSPPTVRPPPYAESSETCPVMNMRENWIDTICGDLNKGYIPANPLGHKFPDGASYPFEIIKNKTLAFFRHALPVLKSDKSLPKVARFNPYEDYQLSRPKRRNHRVKRSAMSSKEIPMAGPTPWELAQISSSELKVEGRGNSLARNRFCESPASLGGLLCKMYNTMWGKTPHLYQNQYHQRFDSSNEMKNRHRNYPQQPQPLQYEALHQAEAQPPTISAENPNLPATPCPSSAEYLTPVFARNHEGAWRYVVQIPREGYFTQTVEVTKCAETNCYFMEGSCRTSPRWQSLLVAEMYYPDKAFPLASPPTGVESPAPPAGDFQKYQQYLSKRKARTGSGDNNAENDLTTDQIPPQCDGMDEIGCFQVRLFYDWFLIPGSCKCWRTQFDFTRVHQSRR